MAKAPPAKPKSSFADWFRNLASPKPKPKAGARPAASASSTMTNLPAAGGPETRPGPTSTMGGAAAKKPLVSSKLFSIEGFSLPLIGRKPNAQISGFASGMWTNGLSLGTEYGRSAWG